MKTILQLAFVFVLTEQLQAQVYESVQKINKHVTLVTQGEQAMMGMLYDGKLVGNIDFENIYEDQGLLIVQRNNRSGAYDMTCKPIIPIEYDGIECYYSHIAASSNNLVHYYSKSGKLLVPNGSEVVESDDFYFLVRNKSGLMAAYDYKGNLKVPFRYPKISVYNDNLVDFVVTDSKGKKFVYLNEKAMPVLNKTYMPSTSQLYAKSTEVSIEDYFVFLSVNRFEMQLPPDEFNALLPDTNSIEPKLLPIYRNLLRSLQIENPSSWHDVSFKEGKYESKERIPMEDTKLMNEMLLFPVTGVTVFQAQHYAKWLTEYYNSVFFDDFKTVFRLPTETEWTEIAESGLRDSMLKNHCLDSLNDKGCMLYIYANLPKCSNYDDYLKNSMGGGSTKVNSMNLDWNGNRQLFGNVAELVEDTGFVKGGSYFQAANQAPSNLNIKTTVPQSWVGFRLVAERVEQ